MAAGQTEYLKLVIFPDLTGIYRREITAALVGAGGNMEKLDAAFAALAAVAKSGSYADLTDTPEIPPAVPVATVAVAGKVRPDGDTITIDADGTLHGAVKVALATVDAAGIVKPDGETITVDESGILRAAKVKDCYTKDEVDRLLRQLSELVVNDADIAALYAKTDAILMETNTYTGLGGSLLTISDKVDTILKGAGA